ncbi:flagellar hook-length control protein FliK [Brevibacillus sp. GCM10020057]|uniref:flagellar hook-length control protein FliK n=1 Tax=Brevibacillus sp. GCM10020057 TaxID=3317327 RepID=UPI0036255390
MNVTAVTTPTGASGTVTANAGTVAGGAGIGDLFSMQLVQALQTLPTAPAAEEAALPLPGASVAVTANTGTTAGEGEIGDLSLLQLVQALQTLPTADEAAQAPEGLRGEDLDALQDVMMLLAQMMASGQSLPQDLAPVLEEKAGVVHQLLQKVQAQFPQATEDWKQLLMKLADGEPATVEVQKLSAMLEDLKGQMGVQEHARKKTLLLRSDVITSGNSLRQDASKNIQQLRFHQGLSAYKAEAGIPSQTVQPSSQGAGLNHQEAKEDSGMPFVAVQGPAASGTQVQTNPTLPQPTVQTHQVHANQLTKQVTQLFVKQMKLTQVNGLHEAKLILNPQSLGKVDVTITSHNGVITAHFSAETQAGKDLLDNQLPQLRAALTQQGLQVDRLEVNQQQEVNFGFQEQREQARQQQEQNRKRDQQEEQEFVLEALVDSNESKESLWNRLRGIDDIV